MKHIAGLMGWISFWMFIIALLNFWVKYINKKYINKLSKYKNIYVKFMKYIVKYHKVIGIIAFIALIVHAVVMYMYKGLSLPGLVAAIIMFIVFALGIYGYALNKKMRGSWLKVHRVLSFILLALIVFHVAFSKFLLIRR